MLTIAFVLAAIFWTASIADVIAIDADDVVRMSKGRWVAFVMAAPVVGGVLWLRRGRGTHKPFPATLPAHGMPGHR